MKKQLFSLVLIIILLSSIMVMADDTYFTKDVLFPNFSNNFSLVKEEAVGQKDYDLINLPVDGTTLKGSAVSEWSGHNEASYDIYEINLVKEGVVSIVLDPAAYDEEYGSLIVNLMLVENRTGEERAHVLSTDSRSSIVHKRDDGWYVVDRLCFYGYPGTYYLKVAGEHDRENDKFTPIDYTIRAVQDDKVARVSGFTPDITYFYTGGTQSFGEITLDGAISISDSIYCSSWVGKAKNSNYASQSAVSSWNGNYLDQISIKTLRDGPVQLAITTITADVAGSSTEAMDICRQTWRDNLQQNMNNSSNKDYVRKQLATEQFADITIGYPAGGAKYFRELENNQVVSFEAKANTVYTVKVRDGINSCPPFYYTLKLAGPGHSIDEVSSPELAQPPVADSQPVTTPIETAGQPLQTTPATEAPSASGGTSLNDFQFTQAPLYDGAVANEPCGIMLYGGKFTNGRIKGNRRDGNRIDTPPLVFYNKQLKYAFTPYGNKYMAIYAGIDEAYYQPVYSLDHSWDNSLVLKSGERVYVDLTFSAAGMTNHVCTGNYYGEPSAKVIYQNSVPADSGLIEKIKKAHSFYIRFCDNYDNENNKVCLNDLQITPLEGQPAAPPNAVQGTAQSIAEAFENGNLITWQPVSDALGYRPFRSENQNELGISVTDFYLEQTEHVDVNVEPNVTYYYTVKPVLAEADPLNDKAEVLGDAIATYTVKTAAEIVDVGKSKQYIKLKIDDPNMDVNGIISEVDPGRGTTPLIVRGRTVVPIRAIVEAMGGTIDWDGTARKVTITARGNSVEMWLDKKEIAVNGVKQAIDVAPESINGRTMVPIRFATENLDCKISWINSTRQVIVVFTDK
ncbi:MAG: hypothetical protein CSA13_01260 [Clostridiales bacterium]|nr:MAG: hypothetical protein CSA13_01260 [Clostridiales bacterium]